MAIIADGVRAVAFTRHGVGAARLAVQREAFRAACSQRGWVAGGEVCQIGAGGGKGRAWAAVRRLVRARRYDVVVVDGLDTIGASESEIARELVLLRHAGVRLLVASTGWDTVNPMMSDLLVGALRTVAAVAGAVAA
ncbi:recombinase family protein [Frankia sp. AgB1.9]|uniref:recombinase family protein n=1 Tax=unclassified Frankia TaxID=2632575 RepID=UPI0019345A27|nr:MULTISPECIES: recombinase family protein [unclassified Frankia]MBL7489570.1 recombinase family protein [Frankia sp. AgW1.1]MBL7550230.1 recombinase family protein [Frankia sp. AgB1.9]MBL7619891.1 recombinase family protein [Frankia sp. AgB1.8]